VVEVKTGTILQYFTLFYLGCGGFCSFGLFGVGGGVWDVFSCGGGSPPVRFGAGLSFCRCVFFLGGLGLSVGVFLCGGGIIWGVSWPFFGVGSVCVVLCFFEERIYSFFLWSFSVSGGMWTLFSADGKGPSSLFRTSP